MHNTRLSFTRETISIICHLVTPPFKFMYFQISCKNSCRITIEATMMKKAPNESKLINALDIFIIVSLCLLISYGSHLNTQTNLKKMPFFGDVNVASMRIVIKKSFKRYYKTFFLLLKCNYFHVY